jgi:hypothetical protein
MKFSFVPKIPKTTSFRKDLAASLPFFIVFVDHLLKKPLSANAKFRLVGSFRESSFNAVDKD